MHAALSEKEFKKIVQVVEREFPDHPALQRGYSQRTLSYIPKKGHYTRHEGQLLLKPLFLYPFVILSARIRNGAYLFSLKHLFDNYVCNDRG